MSNPTFVKPSLDDARERVRRAEYHIGELENTILDWITSLIEVKAITFSSGQTGVKVTSDNAARVPPKVSILIGETIHNLRAALDYIAFALYRLDSVAAGTWDEGLEETAKFLIVDTPNAWRALLANPGPYPALCQTCGRKSPSNLWVRSITPKHQTALELLQPYKVGREWIRRLNKFSNIDKHRHLVMAEGIVTLRVEATFNRSATNQTVGTTGNVPVGMKREISALVLFEGGPGVIETIQEFQREVAGVVQTFDPDFQ